MKNLLKTIASLAFIAVLSLGFLSCPEEDEEGSLTVSSSGAQTTITITGIPDEYENRYASGGVVDQIIDVTYVLLPAKEITEEIGTSNTFKVTVGLVDENGKAVSISGKGDFALLLYSDLSLKTDKLVHAGEAYNVVFTAGENTITWASLDDVTPVLSPNVMGLKATLQALSY